MSKENLSKEVLNRWAKDYNLPIKIYSEPYFSYLIDLYDDYLNTKSKYELLKQTINQFKSEEKFLSYYYEIRDNIINAIKQKEEFKYFNEMDMNKFNIASKYPTNSIYKSTSIDKYFISIDLVKANYQALKYVSPEIVFNTESYEEFIGLFTDLEYMSKSKYLRQVIFGNMNPKRQVKVERFLIEKVIDYLCANDFAKENIQMTASDEVVFELSKEEAISLSKDNNVKNLMDVIKKELNIQVDIEIFELKAINDAYVKEFISKDGYELKSVPQLYFPQIYKKYNGLELNEKDLVFFHEGRLAKFLEEF